MNKILFVIFKAVVNAASPALRTIVLEFIDKLETAAAETPNEWDDVLVEVLKALFDTEDS